MKYYSGLIEKTVENYGKEGDFFLWSVLSEYLGLGDNINQKSHPFLSIITVEVSPDNKHQHFMTLIISLRAEIHKGHIKTYYKTGKFHAVNDHENDSALLEDRLNDDVANCLLDGSLTGYFDEYRYTVLQSPLLNSGIKRHDNEFMLYPIWSEVENQIYDFSKADKGFVRWTMLVEYRYLPTSRRPTAFRLVVRYYNKDRKPFEGDGYKSVNEYFFPNAPTAACENTSDSWWDIYWWDIYMLCGHKCQR